MILCIDVGNSHFFGGVFEQGEILLRFRHTSRPSTSDELGIFLKSVLRENGIDPSLIRHIGLCSVVPHLDYSLRAACKKYFNTEPFVLQAGVKTGLNIRYRNPLEVGADRIANAIAATHIHPKQSLILIDFGTAITFCAVDADKNYLGGAILPGLRLSMEALQAKTAKLPSVEIIRAENSVGRSTTESMQAGLYYGILGGSKEIIKQIRQEVFVDEDVMVIGTGGFASLFKNEDLYDVHAPDLVLKGIYLSLLLNRTPVNVSQRAPA